MNISHRPARRKLLVPSLIVLLICGHAAGTTVRQAERTDPAPSLKDRLTDQLSADSEVSAAELAGATEMVNALPITDWLGPLAPIALSPFFGVTCLSGMAMWGGDWLPLRSGLLNPEGPLGNPAVFWVFLTLTVLTSVPRLTKVSKPFAQAVDHIEAYAGIATLLILKLIISSGSETPTEDVALYSAGVFTFTADMLLMLAMTINMVVIHAVRFFFEFLIWITPVPFIDACFEAGNKALCAGLMVLYGYSPTIATAVNLILLVACLLIFRWIHRRVVFCRTMALDPILSRLFPKRGVPSKAELTVFPVAAFGPFPARAKCSLEPHEDGWLLTNKRWFRPALTMHLAFDKCEPVMLAGILANTLQFNAEGTRPCSFSKRYTDLPALAGQLRCATKEREADAGGGLKAEFA